MDSRNWLELCVRHCRWPALLMAGVLLGGLPGGAAAGPKGTGSPPPTATTEPAPRFWHSIATADGSRLAMFAGSGGYQNNWQNLNDLWFYNAALGKWALAPTGRAKPSVRRSVGWSCDGAGCVAANGITTSLLRETWVYTFASGAWTQVNCTRYLCPSARMIPTMAYDPFRGYHVLFGGDTGVDAALGDTYTFAAGFWNAQYPDHKPSRRFWGAATFVPDHYSGTTHVAMNRVVLMGGYGYEDFAGLCDMWSWNGSDWEQVSFDAGGAAPPCLHGHSMAWVPSATGDRLIVSGGYADPPLPPRSFQDIPNADTWTFTFTATNRGMWSKATQSCSGTPTSGAMMARDQATGKRVYFGGVMNLPGQGAVAYSNLVICQ